jgi:hypothetical protein
MDPQTATRPGMTQVGRYPLARSTELAATITPKKNLSDTSVSGCILAGMSLFHLPPGFPPQLAFLWPLIWVQVLMLRAQIRAAYGRGVKYRWSVTDNLRVSLVSIDWIPGQKSEREWLKPRANFNDRLAAACDGRAAALEYLHLQSLIPPLAPADDVRLHVVESPGERGFHLPLPET